MKAIERLGRDNGTNIVSVDGEKRYLTDEELATLEGGGEVAQTTEQAPEKPLAKLSKKELVEVIATHGVVVDANDLKHAELVKLASDLIERDRVIELNFDLAQTTDLIQWIVARGGKADANMVHAEVVKIASELHANTPPNKEPE